MPVNRKLWIPPFPRAGLPPWPCPSCEAGSINVAADSLRLEETPESRAAQEHEAWEPEWTEGVFAAEGRCVSPLCKQLLSIGGSYGLRMSEDYAHQIQYYDEELTPIFLHPSPPLFAIPEGTPQNVEDAVRAAFALYWPSPTASAAQMRTAIEYVLSDRRVPRRRRKRSGSFVWLSLHERIERFKASNAKTAEFLSAVRWLGNEGAHGVEISREDVLTGFELVDLALDTLYEKRTKRIQREAKRITRRRRRGSHGKGA